MKEWIVAKEEAGGQLVKYCKARLSKAPDSFFYKMARKKNLTVNDKKCTGKEILKAGDSIKLYVSDDTIALFSAGEADLADGINEKLDDYNQAFAKLKGISVIEEEEDFLFVYKPSGMLSQKAKPEDLSLNEWCIGYLLSKGRISKESLAIFRPSVLNRLDYNTSGLVMCGITPRGSRFGSEIIRNKSLRKFYVCEVTGNCRLEGKLKGFLTKDEKTNTVSFYKTESETPSDKKVSAVSIAVKPLSYNEESDTTRMEVELFTGKSHQIRAIMAGFGYPLSGDMKYGKSGKGDGQKLCACRLEFPEITGDFAPLSRHIIRLDEAFYLTTWS